MNGYTRRHWKTSLRHGCAAGLAALLISGGPEPVRGDDAGSDDRERLALQLQVETLSQLLRKMEMDIDQLEEALQQSEARRMEEALVRGAVAMREQLSATEAPDLAWSLNDAGLLMAAEGRLEMAQILFERSLTIIEAHLGDTHAARGTVLQNLGEVLWRRNDPAAIDRFRDAAIVFGTKTGGSHPRMAALLNTWATALGSLGRAEEAETLLRRAIDIYEQQRERHPLDLVAPLYNLAQLLIGLNRAPEAWPLLERAHTVLRRNRDTQSTRMLLVLRAMAQQQRAVGNLNRASRYEEQVGELALKHAAHPSPAGR